MNLAPSVVAVQVFGDDVLPVPHPAGVLEEVMAWVRCEVNILEDLGR